MTDEIQKAIDISNLTDEQIFELYSDVIEWGDSELMAGYCWCYISYGSYCGANNVKSSFGYYCTRASSSCYWSSSNRTWVYTSCSKS